MEIYTIGFTQSSASDFFERLSRAKVKRLVDVRLNNKSQLAGFAKRDDLRYFLRAICRADYQHQPLLAPTQEMLDRYKKNRGSWVDYEREFLELMQQREIETQLDRASFSEPSVLLCSESTSEYCHRRLVIEYLQRHWPDVLAVDL